MKQFYVYLHCKPDGMPFYVGKGHGNRCRDFKRGRSTIFKNTVAKYGPKNIGVFVFDCLSEAEALEDEQRHIRQLRDEGYPIVNITHGGDGVTGLVHSEETRAKLREARARQPRLPCSEETKAKIRAAQIGKLRGPNPEHSERLKGRKLSAEHVKKIADANTGKKRSPEVRDRLSQIQQSRPPASAQARANMSAAHKGKPPSEGLLRWCASSERRELMSKVHKGKTLSEETKAKISATKKGLKWPL